MINIFSLFNPLTDELTANDGTRFKLSPPKIAPEIPEKGFKDVRDIYVAPADDPDSVEIIINKDSDIAPHSTSGPDGGGGCGDSPAHVEFVPSDLLSLLLRIIPAWNASRLSPLEALRRT